MKRAGEIAVALAVSLGVTGCVQRRMTIRSNPPGAYVYVDNYPIGTTPVSTDFVYYGKRQFRLVRDGFETLTVDKRVWAPWYEWFGIDFISENLIPYNIRDEQTLNFQLVPQQVPSIPQLTARSEELRSTTQAQRFVPPPPAAQIPPGQLPPPAASAPPAGPPIMAPQSGPTETRIPAPATGQPIYVMPAPTGPPPSAMPAPGNPPPYVMPPAAGQPPYAAPPAGQPFNAPPPMAQPSAVPPPANVPGGAQSPQPAWQAPPRP
jgi:PEGA domain